MRLDNLEVTASYPAGDVGYFHGARRKARAALRRYRHPADTAGGVDDWRPSWLMKDI
jgi:hypothetical protein